MVPQASFVASHSQRSRASRRACRLCPFFEAPSLQALVSHVRTDHSPDVRYVASGSKQLYVAYAIHDDDAYHSVNERCYIARSATVLRDSIRPALPRTLCVIDRHIVFALSHTSTAYLNAEETSHARSHRRVGNTYYDASFAEWLLREALMLHGRARPLSARYIATLSAHSALTHLVPSSVELWLKLIEDVFTSQIVSRLQSTTKSLCFSHNEFAHISIDATIRILRRVTGQADYRSSRHFRQLAPIPDAAASRRVLTVMGRTSALLATSLMPNESTTSIALALTEALSPEERAQVRSISTDQPSQALLEELRVCFPNLLVLALDPVHLAITYEMCHFRKKTPGSKQLRVLLNKFNKEFSPGYAPSHVPVAFDGLDSQPLFGAHEEYLRECITSHAMPLHTASDVLANIDPNTAWTSFTDFLEALAALSSVHRKELQRRTHVNGVPLKRLLYNVTGKTRIGWLHNNLALRLLLPRAQRSLLPSGTAANEAVHAEINAWFRTRWDRT